MVISLYNNVIFYPKEHIPSLISGQMYSVFESKYQAEMVANDVMPFAYFDAACDDNKHIISIILNIIEIYNEKID